MSAPSMLASPDVEPFAPIALTRQLVVGLEEAGVRYCHWKSTTSLGIAMAGRTDLDLLVLEDDAARFDAVAAGLGFKPFRSHESRQFPGVRDLLGLDADSGRLVHLHVYHRLVLGERYVKNHHLPIEHALVDTSQLRDGVRVPAPEMEAMILAVRTLLKYRDVDALRDITGLGRRGGMEPGAVSELRDLAGRVDLEHVRETARRHLPELRPDVVTELLDLAVGRPRDALALVRLRREVRRAMAGYRRRSALAAWLEYARARAIRQWPISLVAKPMSRRAGRRKSPMSGGRTVAIVGPDGAGKTTVIAALDEWLAWRVNTAHVYLGSAQPSPATRAMKRVAKLGRGVARRLPPAERVAAYLMALRFVGDARDRRTRMDRARRLASRGHLVFLDRYPLAGSLGDGRTLDGPRIRAQLGTRWPELRRLARIEEGQYRDLPRPDHVVVLRLRPEVALERKGSRDPSSVVAKAAALASVDWDGLAATEVDAEQPLDDVLRDVRAAIWGIV